MRVKRLTTTLAACTLALALPSAAHASSIDANGQLVWEPDALLTFGFESLTDAKSVGAAWTSWGPVNDGIPSLVATPVDASSWGAAVVTGQNALEGSSAIRIAVGSTMALALRDASLFQTLTTRRIRVSMWGRAFGAEPELDVVIPSTTEPVGPDGFAHVIAIRTGNETSDGWVEYSTGPIDAGFYGSPIAAIVLTARVSTTESTLALDDTLFAPGQNAPVVIDLAASAVIDAVEIESAPGPLVSGATCTQATVTTACFIGSECMLGACVDGAYVWGPVPASAAHRQELVERVAFMMTELQGARAAATIAKEIFTSAFIASTASATDPHGFFSVLSAAVANVRNGHTTLGRPLASRATNFYPYVGPGSNTWSGYLDVCLGLAENDLPGGEGAKAYAVYYLGDESVMNGTLHVGDLLVSVDGMNPDDWIATLEARTRPQLPDDPASVPTGRGLALSLLMGTYASSAIFASCANDGACTETRISPSSIAKSIASGYGPPATTSFSRLCSPRFVDAVSTWTPTDDNLIYDVPIVEMNAGVATLELDGFEAGIDLSRPDDVFHAWTEPVGTALAANANVLVDARQGHGGNYALGVWLASFVRDTSEPLFEFGVPRGGLAAPNPSWLFDASLAGCLSTSFDPPDICDWLGRQIAAPMYALPPAADVKVAWLDGNDVSMNDITPKLLQGIANVQIYGPHPTTGAFGEISQLPSFLPSWLGGSVQVLDMRFGDSFPQAVVAPWASGHGVLPDVVVTQKVSDLLTGTDTALEAARAWLAE